MVQTTECTHSFCFIRKGRVTGSVNPARRRCTEGGYSPRLSGRSSPGGGSSRGASAGVAASSPPAGASGGAPLISASRSSSGSGTVLCSARGTLVSGDISSAVTPASSAGLSVLPSASSGLDNLEASLCTSSGGACDGVSGGTSSALGGGTSSAIGISPALSGDTSSGGGTSPPFPSRRLALLAPYPGNHWKVPASEERPLPSFFEGRLLAPAGH
jgi:hypothetical protein